MPKIIMPDEINKLDKQITALEYLIKRDTKEKDRLIHIKALEDIKRALEGLNARS